MPGLIEEGKVYAAVPPLYRIRRKKIIMFIQTMNLKKLLRS